MTTNRIRPSVKQIKLLEDEIAYLRQQNPGKELTRLQALVDSMEAANIQRQGIIDSFSEVRKQHAEGAQKLKQRIRELEDRLSAHEVKELFSEHKEIVDYGLVSEDLLNSFALATLQDNEYLADELRDEIEKAATFKPHSQQQIIVDEHGRKRFRKNVLIDRLVHEAGGHGLIGLNYIATLEASREDRAQLAQLIGYSVDGYLSLDYSLPVKEEK